MSQDERTFKDGKSFLDDFFKSFGEDTPVSPSDYFNLFQEPVDFPELLQRCEPSTPPQVLLIDGQSRAGKTWTAVGLVKELLNERLADTVWSSGEDGDYVYADGRTTIAAGIEWVKQSLATFVKTQVNPDSGTRLVILLDDFFGPARLREITSEQDQSGYNLVRDCLVRGGYENPILESLRPFKNVAASLIVTGRSSIFTLAEIQLGLHLGERLKGGIGRSERAIYQHVSGKLVGAGTDGWLEETLKRHSDFVREHEGFALPPMTAFSKSFPDTGSNSGEIPGILFGGDLRAIIEELKFVPSSQRSVKPNLNRLLLVYVAPALVLPLPSIDSCLIGGTDDPKKIRAILALQPEEHGDFALRVPNQYYLQAIQQELLNVTNLELLADSLSQHAKGLAPHCGKHMWVLSRGIIERSLELVGGAVGEERNTGEQDTAEIREALSTKFSNLPGMKGNEVPRKEKYLLQWEAALASGSIDSQVMARIAEAVPRHPGLASAIGWCLYRFGRNQSIESATLDNICGAFERSAKELKEKGNHQVLTVAYSNFIRWTAQMEEVPAEQSPIHQLAQIPASIESHHKAKAALRMVLEDALIWADSVKLRQDTKLHQDIFLSVRNLPSARELWDALQYEAQEPATAAAPKASLIANRLFSLEWHNEWKERPGYRRDTLVAWLENNREVALELIRRNPDLLDDNLNYHWMHMIAQWTVWARDWCFAPDPNHHEYHREPIGCGEQSNNRGIYEILSQAMTSALEHRNRQNRLRNAFFLLSIRAGGPAESILTEVHRNLSEVLKQAGSASRDIQRDLVQAIYELIRQGYIEWTDAEAAIHQDTNRIQLPNELRAQYVEFLNRHGSDEWHTYLKELDGSTCLDVLPQFKEDLTPYGRAALDATALAG